MAVKKESPIKSAKKRGNLTSIKEYNESQENGLTSNLSRNMCEFSKSLRVCDETEQLIKSKQSTEQSHVSHSNSTQQQCNFGGDTSPIKKPDTTSSAYSSPVDKWHHTQLNEQLAQSRHNEQRLTEQAQQYQSQLSEA